MFLLYSLCIRNQISSAKASVRAWMVLLSSLGGRFAIKRYKMISFSSNASTLQSQVSCTYNKISQQNGNCDLSN